MSIRSAIDAQEQAVNDMEAALLQSRADVAAGRVVVESARAHVARLDALLAEAEVTPIQARSGPLLR